MNPPENTSLPVETGAAADRAMQRIKQMIVDGELSPGQRLVEADLIGLLGVSRGTLREAFRGLAADGVLVSQHNKGITVRQPSNGDLIDMMRVHEALESLAARLAATSDQRLAGAARLSAIHERMGDALKRGDPMRFLGLYAEFHETIFELSSNQELVLAHNRLILYVFRRQVVEHTTLPLLKQWHDEHAGIIVAIKRGDGEAAQRRTAEHIGRFVALLQQRLPKKPG